MTPSARRLPAALGTAAIAAAALLTPTTAAAAAPAVPAIANETAATCQIETSSLGWGMKQSFRQYITGAIANGSWETKGDVTYIAPTLTDTGAVEPGTDVFEWTNGTGELASTLESGTVSFSGTVHFSGHEGGLELNIADPEIEFDGADTAYLLLAISETPTPEADSDAPLVRAAKLDLTDRVTAAGQQLDIVDAPVRLTADGADAFNGDQGSYVAGEEMDPLTLSATVTGCELGAVTAPETPVTEADPPAETEVIATEPAPADPEIPWVPIIIGGVALIVIGVTAGMLISGRGANRGGSGAPGSGSDGTAG